MQHCGNCKYWDSAWFTPQDSNEDDDLGRCKAMDHIPLPYAWRYATREVMSVQRSEGEDCAAWVDKALDITVGIG